MENVVRTDMSYFLNKNDNIVSLIHKNAINWKRNKTLVILDDEIVAMLMVIAYDYEITKVGECSFYFDPLNEHSVKIKRAEDLDKYILESAIIGDASYNYTPYQAFANSIYIGMEKQEKTINKKRG